MLHTLSWNFQVSEQKNTEELLLKKNCCLGFFKKKKYRELSVCQYVQFFEFPELLIELDFSGKIN